MIIHVVRPGESVYTIARRYGVSPERIISDNELAFPDRLVVGETLVIIADTIRHTVVSGDSLFRLARRYGTTVQAIQDLSLIHI